MKTDLSQEKWILLHKIPKEDILEYILKWEFEWFWKKMQDFQWDNTIIGDSTSIPAKYPDGISGDYFLFVDKAKEEEDKN